MNRSNVSAAALIAGGSASALAGLVVQAAVQPMTTVSDDLWSYPWTSDAFVPISVLYALIHLVVIVGLLGIGRGRGPLMAVAGTALLLVGELAGIPLRDARLEDTGAVIALVVFGLGTVLSGAGLLVTAAATRRPVFWVAGVCTLAIFGFGAAGAFAAGVALYGLSLAAIGVTMLPATALREQPA